MVSESQNSSGVVLPYEQAAIRGDEMPDGLDYPDQVMFLNLRMLYAQKRMNIIDRDTAVKEKKKLLDEYRQYKFHWEMGEHWTAVIKATELARAECRKHPSQENTMKLIEIIEGRKLHELS